MVLYGKLKNKELIIKVKEGQWIPMKELLSLNKYVKDGV